MVRLHDHRQVDFPVRCQVDMDAWMNWPADLVWLITTKVFEATFFFNYAGRFRFLQNIQEKISYIGFSRQKPSLRKIPAVKKRIVRVDPRWSCSGIRMALETWPFGSVVPTMKTRYYTERPVIFFIEVEKQRGAFSFLCIQAEGFWNDRSRTNMKIYEY